MADYGFDVPLNAGGRVEVRRVDGLLYEVANEPDVAPPTGGLRVRLADGSAASVPYWLATATPDPIASSSTIPAPLVIVGAITLTPAAIVSTGTLQTPTLLFGPAVLRPAPVVTTGTVQDPTVSFGPTLTISPDPIVSISAVPIGRVDSGYGLDVPADASGFATVLRTDGVRYEVANSPNLGAPAGQLAVRLASGSQGLVPFYLAIATPDPIVSTGTLPGSTVNQGLVLLPAAIVSTGTLQDPSLVIAGVILHPDPIVSSSGFPGVVLIIGIPEPIVLTPSALVSSSTLPPVLIALQLLVVFPQPIVSTSTFPAAVLVGALVLTPQPIVSTGTIEVVVVLTPLTLTPATVQSDGTLPAATVAFGASPQTLTPSPIASAGTLPAAVLVFGTAVFRPQPIQSSSGFPGPLVVLAGPLILLPAPVESNGQVPVVIVIRVLPGGSGPHRRTVKTRAPRRLDLGAPGKAP